MTRKASQFLTQQARSSQFWAGAGIYEQCLSEHEAVLKQADGLYTYGYEFLGMAYSVYIHQLIEKIQQGGLDHVVFVAREGYLFKKVYEILTQAAPGILSAEVTTAYAYLSRVSTFLASSPQLTPREIVLSNYRAQQQGLWSTLKFVGLPVEEFEPLAQAHGLDIKRPITDHWNDRQLLAFLNDGEVQSRVRSHHERISQNLYDYLGQCGFWGKNRKVALVDIGWDGTIQDNLVRAFNHLPEFPLLHGLYFGRRNFKTFLQYSASFSNGLISDYRDNNITRISIDACLEIFEKGAAAPHASTVGYEKHASGSICPVFKSEETLSRREEVAANASIAVMQQGILDFAYQYGQQLTAQAFPATTGKPFVQGLITRHIAFPTYQEAYQVAHQLGAHAEDMGEETVRGLAIKPKEFWHAIKSRKIKKAKGLLKSAAWNSGSLRLIGIPGVHLLYTIKRYLSA